MAGGCWHDVIDMKALNCIELGELVTLVHHCFTSAYFARAVGCSEQELLIDYDIEAAGCDESKEIQEICRRAIHAAVVAFEKRVPFFSAITIFSEKLSDLVQEIFYPKRKPKRQANRQPNIGTTQPAHAVD